MQLSLNCRGGTKLWSHSLHSHVCMNGPREFQNFSWALGQKPTSKFEQFSTNSHYHISSFSFKILFIYRCLVETVKLNFHLEFYATLDHNLNSGLCLELVSHKFLTDTGLPQGFPAGGAYTSYSRAFHEFIREHPILTDCDVNSQIHIGVFLRRCSAGQHLCLPE